MCIPHARGGEPIVVIYVIMIGIVFPTPVGVNRLYTI